MSGALAALRPATPADIPLILRFIRDLAEYEQKLDEVQATEAKLHDVLFGPTPRAEALIAEVGGAAAGFAIWHHTFSTFAASASLYVEDVYVRPEHRGSRVGFAIFQFLARRAVAEGSARMDWSVLDWNAPAIAFYERLGARPVRGWTLNRLDGDALAKLAG